VHCEFECDGKKGFTVIAAITSSGEKPPLDVIAKGLSDKCRWKFRESHSEAINNRRLFAIHSLDG
jgi:hypothetical protein